MSSFKQVERFLPNNQHTQRKLLNFKFWFNGELSKSAKNLLSESIFYVKNHRNLSQSFFLRINWYSIEYQFRSTFFCYWHFLITSIEFKSLYFLKWCPIFDTSPLHQFSKFNNFLWVCSFLGKNLSNFVHPAWKIDNPYYYSPHILPLFRAKYINYYTIFDPVHLKDSDVIYERPSMNIVPD